MIDYYNTWNLLWKVSLKILFAKKWYWPRLINCWLIILFYLKQNEVFNTYFNLYMHHSCCECWANSNNILILGLWVFSWLRGFTIRLYSSICPHLLSKMYEWNMLQVFRQYALRLILWRLARRCSSSYITWSILKRSDKSKSCLSSLYMLDIILCLPRESILGLWDSS